MNDPEHAMLMLAYLIIGLITMGLLTCLVFKEVGKAKREILKAIKEGK